MKQLEAVIFDWAGTTVDYGCMAPIIAMQNAFYHYDLIITLDEIRAPMGMLKIDHIKTILNMDRVKEHFKQQYHRNAQQADIYNIYEEFEKNIFLMLQEHTTIIPGILEIQSFLREKGIKIGSTTGYTKQMMDIVATSAQHQGYSPDFIIAADEVNRGRPYPYMIHQNFYKLDIMDTRATLKVGDTLVDIEEGLNAGCWTIGVIKGSSLLGLTQQEIEKISTLELHKKIQQAKYKMFSAGAHYVIETLNELPNVIDLIHQKLNTGNTYAS